LGKVYSSRIILFGLQISISPILVLLRTNTYLYKNFYNNLDDPYYDEKVSINKNIFFEMQLAINICQQNVSFKSVREGFLRQSSLENVNYNGKDRVVYIYSDSTLNKFGIWIKIENRSFAYSGFWRDLDIKVTWSINCYEMLSVLFAEILNIAILSQMNIINEKLKIVIFTDNKCTKSILTTYKASCRSKILARLSKLQLSIDITYPNLSTKFIYISTSDNIIADWISRHDSGTLINNKIDKIKILSLIGLFDN